MLEVESQTKLELPRSVGLEILNAPAARIGHVKRVAAAQLIVVEYVQEEELEFRAESLGDCNVLLHAQIHVPVARSCKLTVTVGTIVDTQNGRTNRRPSGDGVCKDVCFLSGDRTCGTCSNAISCSIRSARDAIMNGAAGG